MTIVVFYIIAMVAASISTSANAQSANQVFGIFENLMRRAILEGAKSEWNKIPQGELACLEQNLLRQGTSVGAMVEKGIPPGDARLSGVRASCRAALAAPVAQRPLQSPQAPVPTQSLSATPTFDCDKAKSASARIICLDQEAASADWNLASAYHARRFSLPEKARDKFDQTHDNFFPTLRRTCNLANEQQSFSGAQRQCVLNAYRKRADEYRAKLSGDALYESRLSPEQHAAIQSALVSLDFLKGESDGEFGPVTRTAIKRFQIANGFPESEFLSGRQRDILLKPTGPSPQVATNVQQQPGCLVMDPTGTPLNLRAEPNGQIIGALGNGVTVRVLDSERDNAGKTWTLVERDSDKKMRGWVFRDYISCDSPPVQNEARTDTKPATEVQRPPTKMEETPRLKEARRFLEDVQAFISAQKSVPSITQIASEAANLKIGLDQFDESEAMRTMKKLNDLLHPVGGFDDFMNGRQAVRRREAAQRLADMTIDARKNLFFVEEYFKKHLGAPETTPLVKFKQELEDAVRKQMSDAIDKANTAFQAYLQTNKLTNSYNEIIRDFSYTAAVPNTSEKSRVIVDGAPDDIVMLYNSSSTAPNVWRNVSGDFVFQDDKAALCVFPANNDVELLNLLERALREKGAKEVRVNKDGCSPAQMPSSTDIIAFQRSEILKQPGYRQALTKVMDDDLFREFQILHDYASLKPRNEKRSLEVEQDVERSTRQGYGLITSGDASKTCVLIVMSPDTPHAGGIKRLLRRDRSLIAPGITSEWQFVETSRDLAFRGLQRQQCGYVIADAPILKSLMEALRRDRIAYAFSPIWFEPQEVAQATFDENDAHRQELEKQALADREKSEQSALEELRKKNKESQKSEIERQLRIKYGVRARGLKNDVQDAIKSVTERRKIDGRFPSFSNWIERRSSDQWQTFEVTADISDFGTINWGGRTLDAVIVKAFIQQKNRMLGKYDTGCFLFGFIDDVEFVMQREPFSVPCNDSAEFIKKWTIGRSFQSQWNAN